MDLVNWTLVIAAVQLAATFGGMLAAVRFLTARLDRVEDGLQRVEERLDAHIRDHATGAL